MIDRISEMQPVGWFWNGHVGYFADDRSCDLCGHPDDGPGACLCGSDEGDE